MSNKEFKYLCHEFLFLNWINSNVIAALQNNSLTKEGLDEIKNMANTHSTELYAANMKKSAVYRQATRDFYCSDKFKNRKFGQYIYR